MPVFEEALNTLRKLGAIVVDPADIPTAQEIVSSNDENIVLDTDFKVSFSLYPLTRNALKLRNSDPT